MCAQVFCHPLFRIFATAAVRPAIHVFPLEFQVSLPTLTCVQVSYHSLSPPSPVSLFVLLLCERAFSTQSSSKSVHETYAKVTHNVIQLKLRVVLPAKRAAYIYIDSVNSRLTLFFFFWLYIYIRLQTSKKKKKKLYPTALIFQVRVQQLLSTW